MKIKPKQYAVALYEVLSGLKEKDADLVIKNFINFLAKKNILRFAPQIINQYKKIADYKEGVIDVKIKTARKNRKEDVADIKKFLPEIINRKIKKVNITEELDEKLIGGFVLESDDFIFDSSLKNKLKILKNNLK